MALDFSKLGDFSRQELHGLSTLAEKAERYRDMCLFMKALVEKVHADGENISQAERNLLSVAYKNVVGGLRQAWRQVTAGDDKTDTQKSYSNMIQEELNAVCNEVLGLLKDGPLKSMANQDDKKEDRIFFLKMSADYCRYLAEIEEGKTTFSKEKDSPAQFAEHFYMEAQKLAKEALPETHPTRLGLALNFSVCYYEILKKPEQACELAKQAFDAAIEKLDTLNDDSYKDSTLIMQLLRDNLTLWTQEKEQGDTEQ